MLEDLFDVTYSVVRFLLFFEKHLFHYAAGKLKNYLLFIFA